MSQNSLQKASFQPENGAHPDNLSLKNSSSEQVVKCLSTGAYFSNVTERNGEKVLELVAGHSGALVFCDVLAAQVAVEKLRSDFVGFAWAAVPYEVAQ